MIYHIVKEEEFRSCINNNKYTPASLKEVGFVHCSLESSVIPVANDYYGNVVEKLLLLQIEPKKLKPQTKYEKAKPEEGVSTSHISSSPVFPHVYGPIDISAIDKMGFLEKKGTVYIWPEVFISVEKYFGIKE